MEQDPFKLFPSLLVGIALEVKSNSKKSDYDKINSSTSTSHLSVDDQVKAQDIYSFFRCSSVQSWGCAGLKSKLFGILVGSEVVVSIRRLFNQPTTLLAFRKDRTPNGQ
jgi:hypothetical protein